MATTYYQDSNYLFDEVTVAQELLLEVVNDQHPEWGGGEMTPSVYDTAWVAMVRHADKPNELAFPDSFEWLLEEQQQDGCWSGPEPNSLLPTLAALLALKKAPEGMEGLETAIARAENYLHTALKRWSVREHESVGFEVLAPRLLLELDKLGVSFEFEGHAELLSLYQEKLALAGPELIYSGKSNLIHNLEAFGTQLDFARLKKMQAINGSYGCSPSATAGVLIYGPGGDKEAYAWLQHLTEKQVGGEAGGMPTAYPFDAFEGAWVIYNLAQGFAVNQIMPTRLLQQIHHWLKESLTEDGGSISRIIGIPADSDDTGVILAALGKIGVKITTDSLMRFEREKYFACFEFERGHSISANAHVLAAFTSLNPVMQSRLKLSLHKAADFLYSVRDPQGFWDDKWHLSPYYATASCVLALANHPEQAAQTKLKSTLNWVLRHQSSRDGGWGVGDFSSPEETAYALQILLAKPELTDKALTQHAIRLGLDYLEKRVDLWYLNPSNLPRMWRGKELYTPTRVVMSAILGAIHASKRFLQKDSSFNVVDINSHHHTGGV